MSGLITKDIRLLMGRKRSLLLILLFVVMMSFTMEGSFVVGYISMLCCIFTVSTISYDEYDNGYPFMMTLPISGKLYAQSKYIFSYLVGISGWAISMIVYLASSMFKGVQLTSEDIGSAVIFIPLFMIIMSLMLPLQLKFGAESSRIALAVIAGIVAVCAVLMIKFAPETTALDDVSVYAVLGTFAVIGVIGSIVSYLVSVHVMEHKEY